MFHSLFARGGSMESIQRSLHRSTTMSDNLFLATWIGLIVAFWIGLYYFDKWRKSRGEIVGSSKSLFLELCRAHGLTRSERAQLLKAAKLYDPLQPAVIFIKPDILSRWAAVPPPDNEGYARLSAKIFGS